MRKLGEPFESSPSRGNLTLKQVSCGTELDIVQEGLPEAIPTEMCYLGWQESLAQLAKLVEPEIPD
ncbi:MAG TPA: SRPBCC domain-containing protein [Thermoanaerobaculia bacterium]|nr:SRPBCC domain-containing protein [Thermoanaerobaculia bacterium]